MMTLQKAIAISLAKQRRKLKHELFVAEQRNKAAQGNLWEPVYQKKLRLSIVNSLIEEFKNGQNE